MIISAYNHIDCDLETLKSFSISKSHVVDPHLFRIRWVYNECYVTEGILHSPKLLGPRFKSYVLEEL